MRGVALATAPGVAIGAAVLLAAGLSIGPPVAQVAGTEVVTNEPVATIEDRSDPGTGGFGVGVGVGDSGSDDEPDRPPPPPRSPGPDGPTDEHHLADCEWVPNRIDGLLVHHQGGENLPIVTRRHPEIGHPQRQEVQVCGGVYTGVTRWEAIRPPEPRDLIPGFYAEVVGRVPLPESSISPVPPGVVNLGMWLAVAGTDDVVAVGYAGPYAVRVVATLESTTFDLGNGDVVTCDGGGVEIVDLDTVEEGPCGYTFRHFSDPGEPSLITMTTSWAISYQTDLGDGVLPSIERSNTLAYEVREIQTIGVSG